MPLGEAVMRRGSAIAFRTSVPARTIHDTRRVSVTSGKGLLRALITKSSHRRPLNRPGFHRDSVYWEPTTMAGVDRA